MKGLHLWWYGVGVAALCIVTAPAFGITDLHQRATQAGAYTGLLVAQGGILVLGRIMRRWKEGR